MDGNLKVDGQNCPVQLLCFPEMNLSSARNDMTKCNFTLQVDANSFLEKMSGSYQRWIEFSKSDDAEFPDIELDELGKSGYPPLIEVIKQPLLLGEVLSYLEADFASNLSGSLVPLYWFDEWTGSQFSDEEIILQGICYRKKF